MSIGAEQLEARIARLAEGISRDARFDAALHGFCTGTLAWFREDPRRIGVFGDLGQMAIVGAGFALQGDHGVTLTRLISFASTHRLASPRRVRAICDNLARLGLVAAAANRNGHREKPLRFGGWLEAALLQWIEIRRRAVMPWLDHMAMAAGAMVAQFFAFRVEALDRYGFSPAHCPPEANFFLDHMGGYPLLLELILAAPGASAPSRKGLARAYGVSRPHIARLLARGEEKGWIEAGPGDHAISLAPASRDRLRHWIGRELAIALLALEGER